MNLVGEVQDSGYQSLVASNVTTNGTIASNSTTPVEDENDDEADEDAPAGNTTTSVTNGTQPEATTTNETVSEEPEATTESAEAAPAPTGSAVSGGDGVSVVQFTVTNGRERAEDLIKKLFAKVLIADATITAKQERFFMHNARQEMIEEGLFRVRVVTTDERMSDLIQEIDFLVDKKYQDMQADIVATHLTSGSPDYIKWVKESVSDEAKLAKDEETSPMSANIDDPVPNDPDALA